MAEAPAQIRPSKRAQLKEVVSKIASPKKEKKKKKEKEQQDQEVPAVINNQADRSLKKGERTQTLESLLPMMNKTFNIIDQLHPFIEKAVAYFYKIKAIVEPYHPEQNLYFLMGILMCFFGSHYILLLAAIEAYRITGYQHSRKCLLKLWADFNLVADENRKDNALDNDHDGIADVKQMDKKDLISHKLLMILRVIDPNKFYSALSGLWCGFMAVIATLRLQFAQTITFGIAISDVFLPVLQDKVIPVVERGVDQEYRRWVPFVVIHLSRTIGVSIAFLFERFIGIFYTSIRGANMITIGALMYFNRNYSIKKINKEKQSDGEEDNDNNSEIDVEKIEKELRDSTNSILDNTKPGSLNIGGISINMSDENVKFLVIVLIMTLVGIYSQMRWFFGIPFPFNVFLLPFSIAESILTFFVSMKSTVTTAPVV